MAETSSRLAFVDALKAVALQLIVLHHLAFYGPMSDQAYVLAPGLFSWLSEYARSAVQAFLVIGGFLAARSLAPAGVLLAAQPLALLRKRYLKLVTPYLAAVLIAIACAAIARVLMSHDSIPGRPTLAQVLAHALLLQGVLDYEGLSAGVWYVAIDFQLFALLLGALWLARGLGRQRRVALLGALLVGGLAAASLYHFNRDSAWDVWALYFFGSYALGVLTYWATHQRSAAGWLLLIAAVVVAALLVDFRSRIAVALLVALALGLASRGGFLESWPRSRAIAYLATISYSVFLIHFPVCLVISGLFWRFAGDDPRVNLLGVLVAWLASLLAGALFYRLVENPAQHGLRRLQPGARVMQRA
ncbi:MAG: acyltransferase [Rhodobacteraceae bacterium]|nr:acyltransferase [Paracoccaceae bacterium]MCB1942460.1 acyltransferase [Accumulibacter sp.]